MIQIISKELAEGGIHIKTNIIEENNKLIKEDGSNVFYHEVTLKSGKKFKVRLIALGTNTSEEILDEYVEEVLIPKINSEI